MQWVPCSDPPKWSFQGDGGLGEPAIMMSSNGNIFCVTGHQWITLKKASDAELWSFLWFATEPTAEQTVETPMIWDAITLIMTSL